MNLRKTFWLIFAGTVFVLVGLLISAELRIMKLAQTPSPIASQKQYSAEEHARAWKLAQQQLNEIKDSRIASHAQKCQASWNIIWGLAKAGNPAARYQMGIDLSAPKKYGQIMFEIPQRPSTGRYGKDRFIGFLYGLDVSYRRNISSASKKEIRQEIADRLPTLSQNQEATECVINSPSQACAELAVKAGIIPSYENYAAEIDSYLNKGTAVGCYYAEGDLYLEVGSLLEY